MIILGIDPGLATTGFGIINTNGDGEYKIINFGWIKTQAKSTQGKRLEDIYQQTRKLIKKFNPDIVAIESLFFYNNSKTVIGVSQATGVIKLAVSHEKKELFEYSPLKVKAIITNNGKAKKEEIKKMIHKLLGVSTPKNKKTHFDDAADALGIAICHARIFLESKRKEVKNGGN